MLIKSLIQILLASFLAVSAFANDRGGNGGGVMICGDRVVLADFFEASHTAGLNIELWENNSEISVESYIRKAIKRLRQVPYGFKLSLKSAALRSYRANQNTSTQTISYGRFNDANLMVNDPNCVYKHAAVWDDVQEIVIYDLGLYSRMDNMNKAGLIVHEVLYKFARELGNNVQNSDGVRRLVGRLFSEEVVAAANIQAAFNFKTAAERKRLVGLEFMTSPGKAPAYHLNR